MNKADIIRKFTSRKFWLAVTDFVGMLMIALGYSDSQAVQVTALIMSGAGIFAYIIAEGLTDAANKEVGIGIEAEAEFVDDIK